MGMLCDMPYRKPFPGVPSDVDQYENVFFCYNCHGNVHQRDC